MSPKTLQTLQFQLKKLVEKPKLPPKKEENGNDVNGNTGLSVDDEEEWQVRDDKYFPPTMRYCSTNLFVYRSSVAHETKAPSLALLILVDRQ